MPELLTDDDLITLAQVGQMMCDDMINAARVADTLEQMGYEVVDPTERVTRETTDAWVAIATEYGLALDELEENRTL
jgi:hypothetical protein